MTWPVMHWLSARWIPQTERSKFMTSYHGREKIDDDDDDDGYK